MAPKKGDKGGGGGSEGRRTAGTSSFSMFQLLIFLIATSSMAMNFAMLYGYIPIKGKFMNSSFFIFVLFLKLSNFRDPFKKTTELFSRLKCLSWGRTPSWGQKVSFLTHPFCFFKLLYIFKYYFRMRGSPWKNRRERWEHFNFYGFQKNLRKVH